MKSSFAFTLNFDLHAPCYGMFPLDGINHMDYNRLLLTVWYFGVCQSPELLSYVLSKYRKLL